MKLKFKKLKTNAIIPSAKGNTMEIYACLSEGVWLQPGEAAIVPVGVSLNLMEGYEAQIRPTLNLAEHGITLLTNEVDTKDIHVVLINHSRTNCFIDDGLCIAELAISIAPIKCFVEEETDGHVPYTSIMQNKTPTRDEIMVSLMNASAGKK